MSLQSGKRVFEALKELKYDVEMMHINGQRVEEIVTQCAKYDVAFLALHGGNGENGRLQAALDLAGIKYTGSGYLGSALAMNKSIAKQVAKSVAGVHVANGYVTRSNVITEGISFPCVVKPCNNGSSEATSIVYDDSQIVPAIKAALAVDDEVMIEDYIKGTEISVGVLDGKAMTPIEIAPKQGFYSYENKYADGNTE